MAEIVPSPEIVKKGAPISIILGRHEDASIKGLDRLEEALDRSFSGDNSKRKIVFIESGFSSEDKARLIESNVDSGVLPSRSYGIGRFFEVYGRVPDFRSEADERAILDLLSKVSEFDRAELDILDKYFIKSNKKIGLLFEYRPNDELRQAQQENTANKRLEISVASNVVGGDFLRGLEDFKSIVGGRALDFRRRDERLAERIGAAALDDTVSNIIGFRGAGHVLLGEMLVKKGFNVAQSPVAVSNDFMDQAISEKYKNAKTELSELEWNRFMLGFVIERVQDFDNYKKSPVGNWGRQEIGSFLSRFKDDNSIRKFEKDVDSRGFLQALTVQSLNK